MDSQVGSAPQVVNFMHIQLTCDQLVPADLRWMAKWWKMVKTWVDLRTNLSSAKVNASGSPNETQVERKSKTCAG